MGKVFFALVLLAAGVFGARFVSEYKLHARVHQYQNELRARAFATRRGATSPPTEEEIIAGAEELARELKLEVSNVTASVTEDASPTGAGMIAAEQLGELPSPGAVNADGTVVRDQNLRLRATRLEVQAHVHAKGFLCEVDQDVSDAVSVGYRLQ